MRVRHYRTIRSKELPAALEAAQSLALLERRGRATTPMAGPDMLSVLRKRLTLRGFIVWDFAARQADFLREVGEWVGGGRVKYREDVVEGLENAPAAFLGLLQGKNFGKLLVA
jgi:NADPH-dependent curcumin reductase CurA